MPAAALASAPAPARPLLDALRARLAAVVAPTRRATPPIPTGVAPLDRALDGGLPRGRITEVTGPMGAGKTTLLHRAAARVLAAGGWVAWVDARRTLAPEPFAELGGRFVAVRPRDGSRAAWIADTLLRSGLFALVVVDGAPVLPRTTGFRLAQLAREQDAALVLLAESAQATHATGTVRLRLDRTTLAGRAIAVVARIVTPRRLGLHADIPDRRGAATTARHAWAPRPADPASDHHTHTWGGLGASVGDVHGRSATGTPAHPLPSGGGSGPAHAAPLPSDRLGRPLDELGAWERARYREWERRHERSPDRVPDMRVVTRQHDWASHRGRRRAADPTYGRRSRREEARLRTGAVIDVGLPQGWQRTVGTGRAEVPERGR